MTLIEIFNPPAQPCILAKGCLIEVDCAREAMCHSGCIRWWWGVCTPDLLKSEVSFGLRVKIGISLSKMKYEYQKSYN
jgi:hypothetical protein